MYKGTPITRLWADFQQNPTCQKEYYIFNLLKGKKLTTSNTLPSKTITQNCRGGKEFLRKAKAKGAHQYQNGFTRNVKGTSLNGKENAISRNKKIMKEKISLVKADTVKVVD